MWPRKKTPVWIFLKNPLHDFFWFLFSSLIAICMSTAGCFYTKHVRLNAPFPSLTYNQNSSKCGILGLFHDLFHNHDCQWDFFSNYILFIFCTDMKTEILFLALVNEKN